MIESLDLHIFCMCVDNAVPCILISFVRHQEIKVRGLEAVKRCIYNRSYR